MSRKTCTCCNGYGHDKGSLPVIEFKEEKQPDGTTIRKHTTLKQGSGCHVCLGVGYLEEKSQ